MRSAPYAAVCSLMALSMLFLASPGFAQGLPPEGDPFAGVSAVAAADMSGASGQPGAAGLPGTAGQQNDPACGTACGSETATNLGAPAAQQITYGNATNVTVTAINNQSSSIGTAVINAAGGLNSAGGGY